MSAPEVRSASRRGGKRSNAAHPGDDGDTRCGQGPDAGDAGSGYDLESPNVTGTTQAEASAGERTAKKQRLRGSDANAADDAGKPSRPDTPSPDASEAYDQLCLPGEADLVCARAMGAFDEGGVAAFLQEVNGTDWTANPNELLVANAAELTKLVRETRASVTTLVAPDGGALMRRLGEAVERLSGHRDFAFFEPLPAVGTKALLLRALCELRGLNLAHGGCTLTGEFIDSFERTIGIKIMRSNIAGLRCWRKSKDGVELLGDQAGCVDPTGKTLSVLAHVKELHYLGLRAAGVELLGIIASSNASIASFFGQSKVQRFAPLKGSGTYKDVAIFCTPHPKFVSPSSRYSKSVAVSLGIPLGDRLGVSTQVTLGWAKIAAALMPGESEQAEETTRRFYDALRNDKQSPVRAREWADRDSTTTSPELAAKLKQELSSRATKSNNKMVEDPSGSGKKVKQASVKGKKALKNGTARADHCSTIGANWRESSLTTYARSNDQYKVTYREQGTAKVYVASTLLQPIDRKQEARNNDYVQQHLHVPPFGSTKLSFDRSKAPLWFKRTAEQKDGTKTKLDVHVEKA